VVDRIARDPALFTVLVNTQANVDVVIGDGRLPQQLDRVFEHPRRRQLRIQPLNSLVLSIHPLRLPLDWARFGGSTSG
jgi:hypothetical protein